MKRILPGLIMVVLLLGLTGCISALNPQPNAAENTVSPGAVPTSDETIPTEQAPKEAYPVLEQPSEAYPGPAVSSPAYTAGYPAPYAGDITIGIEPVDRLLAAVTASDPAALRGLLRFTSALCTTAEGLGGPPKCAQGEPEGTPVEGLPILGSEGVFVRAGELPADFLAGSYRLIAIYAVKTDVAQEPFYPPGKYGVVLEESKPDGARVYLTLRVDDSGIVRVDDNRDIPGNEFPDAAEFLLAVQLQ